MKLSEFERMLKSDINIVFADNREPLKYTRGLPILTMSQWKEYFPNERLIFDYINQTVRRQNNVHPS